MVNLKNIRAIRAMLLLSAVLSAFLVPTAHCVTSSSGTLVYQSTEPRDSKEIGEETVVPTTHRDSEEIDENVVVPTHQRQLRGSPELDRRIQSAQRRDIDPVGNFNFMVEIDGVDFITHPASVVRGLESSVEVKSYRYGRKGFAKMVKIPGKVEFSNIVLHRGYIPEDDALFNWYFGWTTGNGDRKNGSIILTDDIGNELKRLHFHEAWPTRYKIYDLDANESAVLTEEIEIVIEGLYM
mmetsp:Transcript_3382/g.6558  ORF Transcript_3382/g.6558 Transcript_3382/m.6558 type:complete len:239 (-) Transcript_3382:2726-3442(-)